MTVLHNFLKVGASGRIFFLSNQSQSYTELQPLSLNKGAKKSTFKKKKEKKRKKETYLYTSLKPISKCKQVDNNNFKNALKNIQMLKQQKKQTNKQTKNLLEFLKLDAVYL